MRRRSPRISMASALHTAPDAVTSPNNPAAPSSSAGNHHHASSSRLAKAAGGHTPDSARNSCSALNGSSSLKACRNGTPPVDKDGGEGFR